MDWMRLVDMAMGAIFGGGLVGTWLELRHQRSIERNRRRERAAEVLAAVMALVEDLSPSQFSFSKPQHRSDMDKLRARREELRSQLLLVAAAHPSRKVTSLERQLDAALNDTVAMVDWLVDETASDSGHARNVLREAWEQHEKAERLLSDFLKAI